MEQSWVQKLPHFLSSKLKGRRSLQEIISNTGWLAVDRIIRMALGLVVAVWLARYLGPARLGIYQYALALVALLGYLTDLGLNGIVVRDIVSEEGERGEIIGTTFVLKIVAGMVSAGLAMTVVWLIRPDDALTRVMVAIFSSQLLLRAFDTIDLWFQSQVRSKYTVYAKTTAFVLGALTKVALILLEASLVAFAWVVAAEALIGAVGLVLMYRGSGQHFGSWSINLRRVAGLLQRSWPLIISGFGAIIYLKVDQIMLGEMVGEAEVGIYSVAAQLSEVWYFIPTAIASSAFPALLKNKQKSAALYGERLQQLYDGLFAMALVIAIPMTFIAGPAVSWIYGSEFSAAGSVLSVHIWASLFVFMRGALSKWLIAEDLYIFSIVTHGCGALVNVGINLILIPITGGLGAAIATVISYAAASYLSLFAHRKTWPAAKMMSLAMLFPVRITAKLIKPRRNSG